MNVKVGYASSKLLMSEVIPVNAAIQIVSLIVAGFILVSLMAHFMNRNAT